MKPCNPTLATALVTNLIPMKRYEIYDVLLRDGVTEYHWISGSENRDYGGNTYVAQGPFLKRSKWKITKTMSIPTMTMTLLSTLTSFQGGLAFRAQVTQGLLAGATIVMSYLYIRDSNDTAIDNIIMFGGVVSTIKIAGSTCEVMIKGANNKLDQQAPRKVYQVSCVNTFCDAGCTLSRGAFTTSYIVGASPTRIFIPWDTPPATPERYQLGTATFTSGPASGQAMNISFADASGLTLSYPLFNTPDPGDTFDAFEGCDKTMTTCDGRGNTQNGLWFPFIPPSETAI